MRRGKAPHPARPPARRPAADRRAAPARRRGILVIDALFGLGLLAMLTTVLIVSVGQHRLGERRMADQQAAWAVAERALAELAHGRPPPDAPEAAHVSWALLQTTPGRADDTGSDPVISPVAGLRWVGVTARVGDARATLVGLAPGAGSAGEPTPARRPTP